MSNIPPEPPDPPNSNGPETINQQIEDPSHYSRSHGRNGRNNPRRNTTQQISEENGGYPGSSRKRRHKRPQSTKDAASKSEVTANEASPESHRHEAAADHDKHAGNNTITINPPRRGNNYNRRGFGARLIKSSAPGTSSAGSKSSPLESDLTTRLIHSLETFPYPDCPICFNPLHPAQPIWCCSLTNHVPFCCWTPFHLKCIKEWAKKNAKDVGEALRARSATNELEFWRCPGCQTKRTEVPKGYLCYCGSVPDPKPGISTPHSCGASCTRQRMACNHPCPLSCHPGPCPPCTLTVYVTCHCGRVTNAMRCGNLDFSNQSAVSCGAVCGRLLQCQTHHCNRPCHSGDCERCEKSEIVTCLCGKNTKEVQCGTGIDLAREAYVLGAEFDEMCLLGRFDCGSTCGRTFDCGIHTCSKSCHAPSLTLVPCPFDPLRVNTCPCGKRPLCDIRDTPRLTCTDPIPSCQSTCEKPLEGCSHTCAEICHPGPCSPCKTPISVPCRCGLTTRQVLCHERQKESFEQQKAFLCDKACEALRLCGRHSCSRVCCPLGGVSRNKPSKSKKKNTPQRPNGDRQDVEKIWHTCNLICGKLLACSLHRCTEADHRGPCPPCYQSSFEEMVCHCGRTVIEPPVPCGTVMSCTHPCARPSPPCGHEKASHFCHEDSTSCPPCPFLTSKPCSCGKMNVNNVRCSQETVLCGQPCEKLLECGFHKCRRSCHGNVCGPCPSICGKPRKLCHPDNHPCTLPCHAPSICDESEPCMAIVIVTCPCGRFQQPTKCGKSFSNPNRTASQLQCRDECAIAKRNAKLAEALGISPNRKEKPTATYSDELVAFARTNLKFLTAVENTLHEFVHSDRKTQMLPYTPENRRKFVRELCQLYRLDTQLIDPEPRRSIQIFRRIDTRIPIPLLTSIVGQDTSGPSNLGKLADLRAISSSRQVLTVASNSSPTGLARPPVTTRGWTSVVAVGQGSTFNPLKPLTSNIGPESEISVGKPEALGSLLNSTVRDNWESD